MTTAAAGQALMTSAVGRRGGFGHSHRYALPGAVASPWASAA
ncbi:hypothetical protein ACF073_35615 [Streptomyces sp. NPDC015171]